LTNTTRIFIDANIFAYFFISHPIYGERCLELLMDIDYGLRTGVISPLIIDEVIYVLMVQKAKELTGTGDIKLIKRTLPEVWRASLDTVSQFYDYIDQLISRGNMKVLGLDYSISRIALECAKEYDLLPRDALHVACCKAYGIEEMATNDRDFEKVSYLRLWKP